MSGSLNSTPNRTFDVDLYANDACDASGAGEGQRWLGSMQVTTDGAGNAAIAATVGGFAADGEGVAATVTDTSNGDTSEFSNCVTVDGLPGIRIADIAVTEGDSDTTPATFALALTAETDHEIAVEVTTADGTAVVGDDYEGFSDVVVIPKGETSAEVPVAVLGDTQSEPDENFTLEILASTGAGVIDGVGVATILSDDPPAVSISDVAVAEGASGTTNVLLTATLDLPADGTVTVDYTTVTGTATAGSDYTTSSGTVTFDPGDTEATIAVAVLGDTLDEDDETFSVVLSAPVGAVVGDGTAIVTITDDDPLPALSIGDVTVNELTGSPAQAGFVVTLSLASGRAVQVTLQTVDVTATSPSDYTATNTVVTIPAGATSVPVPVTIVGDSLDEFNETFTATLTSPVNATVADASATATIVDDDAGPTISVSDESHVESDAGTANMRFTVSLSAPSGQTVVVNFATNNGTARYGKTRDYRRKTGTVIFSPGETSKRVTVRINGDTTDEVDETFALDLNSPTNATIADGSGTGTIVDDDLPVLSVADVSVVEADTTTTKGRFTVKLVLSTVNESVTVAYTTSPGTAEAGADYTTKSGTLTFAPGEGSQVVNITVLGDTTDESDETFTFTLSNPTGAVIGDGTATGTIIDDE